MAYVSLYRKYRSQTFDDVMGQDHVTRTIRNAITAGRIGQGYLFCGSRGTGKTTVARLIAKAVNCVKGPTADPCNECSACLSITEGSAVDIVELDAASHRKVEDIDALRDGVKYPPMQLRYKVYIIDEAHQLSAHAKDAFLKTLEEPPPHAIFILATTEAHEIPLTIRSRCQQFDFRRGSEPEIGQRLRYVATNEGATIDDEALSILSEAAAGSWRDGLSILEQVMTYTEGHVTAEDVGVVLGTIDDTALQQIADVVASRDAASAFQLAGKLVEEGKDIRQLLRSITAYFRRLLLASVGASSDAKAIEQAGKFARPRLLRLVELFAGADKELRFNDQHRLVLELVLLKSLEDSAAAAVEPTIVKAIEAGPSAVMEPKTPVRQAALPPPPPPPPAPKPKPVEPVAAPTEPVPQQAPEEPVQAQTAEPEPVGEITLAKAKAAWPKILMKIKTQNKPLHAMAYEGTPIRVEGSTLTLGFERSYKFHCDKVGASADLVSDFASQVLGQKVKIKTTVSDELGAEAPPQPTERPGPEQPRLMDESDVLVEKALDMFGGRELEDQDEKENTWEE